MTAHHCIHTVPGLHPNHGGPSRTVTQLTDALAETTKTKVTLVSQGLVGEDFIRGQSRSVQRIVCQSSSPLSLALGIPLHRRLLTLLRSSRPSIIHNHGVWMGANHWSTALAKKYGIPVVIQPRGMLEPWALAHNSPKKKIALALYQRRDLEEADAFIATSSEESHNLRSFGLRQPIAMIPNGVDLSHASIWRRARPNDSEPRKVLFLSRVHPKKGLMNLMQAWSAVRPEGWVLQIAGPDCDGHLGEVLREADRLGVASSVQYLGVLDGTTKDDAYRAADIFVLPTFSENFGVVVAEALSHGVPVITTTGAPWADLAHHKCGWWINVGIAPLVGALSSAVSLTDNERAEMGRRAQAYVRRFDWNDIANKTAQVYSWLLGATSRPDCVDVT